MFVLYCGYNQRYSYVDQLWENIPLGTFLVLYWSLLIDSNVTSSVDHWKHHCSQLILLTRYFLCFPWKNLYSNSCFRGWKHEGIHYDCLTCHKSFSSKTKLDLHKCKVEYVYEKVLARNETEKYPCDQCQMVYNIKRSLKTHKYRNHGKKQQSQQNQCTFCNKTFSCKECLMNHLKLKHDSNQVNVAS